MASPERYGPNRWKWLAIMQILAITRKKQKKKTNSLGRDRDLELNVATNSAEKTGTCIGLADC